jgi:hypothetical protein
MFWVIRGTDPKTNQDFAWVVESASRTQAEMWALRRNIPYVIVDEAAPDEIRDARVNKRLWKYTPESRYRCFGQPVRRPQLACLMLAGVATILVLLRNAQGATIF